MTLRWIRETSATWDEDKARIVAGSADGIFDTRYADAAIGALVPAEWWRVERDGETVGFGWLDVNWGDAEILLATAPDAEGAGVGTFILEHLEEEARKRGLRYLYNVVRPTHPRGEQVAAWLRSRGFVDERDGRLVRSVSAQASSN